MKAEAALDSIVKYDFSSSELAVIRHWMEGEFYTPEDSIRQRYYPETDLPPLGWGHWTPTVWFDGVEEVTGADDVDSARAAYNDKIAARLAIPSPLAMDLQVEYGAKDETGGMVQVEVVATDTVTFTDLRLRLAIIESGLSIGKGVCNQVLRDYFPSLEGISFIISQGDTFTHSEEFVIDSTWVAENCGIVAFVQDDTTREVAQAVQGPVISPSPQEVDDLTVTLAGADLLLEWSPVTADTNGDPLEVDLYYVYRDTLGFFAPGSDSFTSTTDTFYVDDSGVVGDTGTHYYYAVTAVAGGKESGFSGTVGEFDRHLAIGK